MIRPSDILAEGRALLALPASQRTEARRRTIISRAYYAAFHFLRAHPCSQDYRKSGNTAAGMHRQFITFLATQSDRRVVYAADLLKTIYENRVMADYHIGRDILPDLERRSVEDADYIMCEIFD